MKKTLLTVLLLLLVCLLSACSLLPLDTSGGDTTTPADTTAQQDVPTLNEVRAALSAAAPTEAHITLTTDLASPDVTLATEITHLSYGDTSYYAYRAEYLHTVAEALATGETIGVHEGHLRLEGATIAAQSGEVDADLLAALADTHVRMPDLRAEYLATQEISAVDGSYLLTATVKDEAIPLLFDGIASARSLSLQVTVDAALSPTSLLIRYIGEGGEAVSYAATYGYRTDVIIP